MARSLFVKEFLMKKFLALSAFFVAGAFTSVCFGQSGAFEYAQQMNNGGFFRHDRNWGGAEVIYRSSGVATQDAAMRWWMNSPPHRRLVQSGQITDIQCVGGVCVGRSGGSSSYSQSTYSSESYNATTSSGNIRSRVLGNVRRIFRR
jgi:hypothetical protein